MDLSNSEALLMFGAGGGVRAWPPALRAPLPPMPGISQQQLPVPKAGCWASAPYEMTLPVPPPAQPDLRYHRGNFCLQIPGFTNGFNNKDRSIVMTWEIPAYSVPDQALVINYYASRFTHIILSIPQTRNLGRNINDLLATAQACKAAGLFVTINCFGGDGENFDTDIKPWLDALTSSKAVDILCVAWQADQHYSPSDLYDITRQVSAYAKPHNLLVVIHWVNGACAWWDDRTCSDHGICDRWSYQKAMAPYVDGHYMQVDTEGCVDELQSAINKVIVSLPPPMFLVMAEDEAQALYDNPTNRPAPYGALKGYLCCCTRSTSPLSGYMNDACQPSGAVC